MFKANGKFCESFSKENSESGHLTPLPFIRHKSCKWTFTVYSWFNVVSFVEENDLINFI
jgi:hypothetical protein